MQGGKLKALAGRREWRVDFNCGVVGFSLVSSLLIMCLL